MKNALTPIRIVRHESAGVCFELAFATPASELRPYVRQFVGWIDHSTTHERRRQVPSANLPLIFNFDAWVHQRKADATHSVSTPPTVGPMARPTDATHTSTHRTFTAGLHERYTTVEMVGGGLGLQVDFTPLGARLYYDRPLVELTNRTVELTDLIGASAGTLTSQLYDAASWQQRIQILEQDVQTRIDRARPVHDAVAGALASLTAARGDVRVRGIADASTWGSRHLTRRFHEEVGLAPKAYARLLRLNRAIRLGAAQNAGSLASIAQACGYYDQAHLARECREIAGVSPSALRRRQLPAGAGFGA